MVMDKVIEFNLHCHFLETTLGILHKAIFLPILQCVKTITVFSKQGVKLSVAEDKLL